MEKTTTLSTEEEFINISRVIGLLTKNGMVASKTGNRLIDALIATHTGENPLELNGRGVKKDMTKQLKEQIRIVGGSAEYYDDNKKMILEEIDEALKKKYTETSWKEHS